MGRRKDADKSGVVSEKLLRETEDRFLKVKEICHFLGISKSTFYKLVNNEESGLPEIVVRLPGVDGPRARLRRLKKWAESGK